MGYETNSPAEFSGTGTQRETEEDEEYMLFHHTSKRQRGRGLVLGNARDAQVRGRGIEINWRDSSRMGQNPATNGEGEVRQEITRQNEELRVVDRRMENAEGRALTDTSEGGAEEAPPSGRWVSEIEHMAAVARPERVPFVATWRRAVVQGLRGVRGGAVGEQEMGRDPRRQQAGVQRGTPTWRQSVFHTLRLNRRAATGQAQGDGYSTRHPVGDSRESGAVNGSGTDDRNVELSMSEARDTEQRKDLRDNVSESDGEGVRGGAEGSIAAEVDNAGAVQEFMQWFLTSEEDRQDREVVGRQLEEMVDKVVGRIHHQRQARGRKKKRKRQEQGGHMTSQEEINEEGE